MQANLNFVPSPCLPTKQGEILRVSVFIPTQAETLVEGMLFSCIANAFFR